MKICFFGLFLAILGPLRFLKFWLYSGARLSPQRFTGKSAFSGVFFCSLPQCSYFFVKKSRLVRSWLRWTFTQMEHEINPFRSSPSLSQDLTRDPKEIQTQSEVTPSIRPSVSTSSCQPVSPSVHQTDGILILTVLAETDGRTDGLTDRKND